MERGQHAIGGVEAGDGVADRGPDHARVLGIDEQAKEAARGLGDGVEGRPVAIRPVRAEARDRAIDQARIDALQPLGVDAEPRGHAGAEVLDEDVGAGDQLVERGEIVRLLGVERDAALVAVVGLEVRAVEPALEGAERIAARDARS